MNDISFYLDRQEFLLGDEFDRHVLGRLVLHAAFEADQKHIPLATSLGLNPGEVIELLDYLHLSGFGTVSLSGSNPVPEDEEMMLRGLLEHNVQEPRRSASWLAFIVARRSMEPNHLWEDLGLAHRPDLTKLLMHYFPSLACKNTRNMRWKRFLYRSLCEAEGFSMCPSPTCDSCSEFHVCYGDESGEAVMARNQRAANLAATKP